MRVNKLLIPILLAIFFSLLSIQNLANAEIKMTPPTNWQPSPNNNSTSMIWFQNSTKSLFGIFKGQHSDSNFTFPLAFVAPIIRQAIAETGALESADQLSFGHSNYGFRYFLNLSSIELQKNDSASKMFKDYGIPNLMRADVPYKGMFILTEKHGDLYSIIFASPKENFDSKLIEIKPTLDSIQLSNSTAAVS